MFTYRLYYSIGIYKHEESVNKSLLKVLHNVHFKVIKIINEMKTANGIIPLNHKQKYALESLYLQYSCLSNLHIKMF